MRSFLLMMEDLHDVVDRAEGLCCVMEVLREFRAATVVVKSSPVFIIPGVKSFSSLTYIGFVAIRAS
jgi:hypothetical protein